MEDCNMILNNLIWLSFPDFLASLGKQGSKQLPLPADAQIMRGLVTWKLLA
jgi:hypothetical protein